MTTSCGCASLRDSGEAAFTSHVWRSLRIAAMRLLVALLLAAACAAPAHAVAVPKLGGEQARQHTLPPRTATPRGPAAGCAAPRIWELQLLWVA